MKSLFSILLIMMLSPLSSCYATISKKKSAAVVSTVFTSQKDTLVLLNALQSIGNKKEERKDSNSFMPWVSALVIALITVCANIYISNNARRTSLEVNRRDFNKTVLSGSRQLWISEFRILMSEIISQLSYFTMKQNLDEIEYKAFSLLLAKAELMLSNEEHKTLVEIILKLQASCSEVLRNNPPSDELDELMIEIKKSTIVTLKNQWDMIKKGE